MAGLSEQEIEIFVSPRESAFAAGKKQPLTVDESEPMPEFELD